MSTGFDHVVSSVEARYDHYSARVVTRQALAEAGLEKADKYGDADLVKIATALEAGGYGDARIWAAMGAAPKGQKVPEPPAAPAAEKKADKAPADKGEAAEAAPEKADEKADKKAAPKAKKAKKK